MRHRTIMYGLDKETGTVISRVGSKVAIPVLDYAAMKPENNFQTTYHLEKINVIDLAGDSPIYTWTRKIPLEIKNKHREFWGMKPLKRRPNSHELTAM